MTAPERSRGLDAAVVAGAVVCVAALVGLAGWQLSQPEDSAGTPLTAAAPSAQPSAPSSTSTLPRPTARDASLGALTDTRGAAPARLEIPDLDVDATVDAVGVQDDGAMVIPAEPTSVGWYRYGSTPSDAHMWLARRRHAGGPGPHVGPHP